MASVMTSGHPAKPRIWPLLVVYLLVWGFLYVPALGGGVYWGFRFALEKEGADLSAAELSRELETGFIELLASAGFLAFSAIAIGGFMLVLAAVAAVASPVPFRERLRLGKGTHATANAWIAAALFAFAVGNLSSVVAVWAFGGLSESLRSVEATIAEAGGAVLLWITLGIAVAAGLGEEFLFRGYMQSRLVERFGAAWGIAITSVAFALLHMDPQHIIAVLPVGVVLGLTLLRTGSIIPCVLAHVLNNGIYVVTAEWLPTESLLDDLPAWFAVSLATSVAAGLWFFRATRPMRCVQANAPAAASPP